MRWANLQHEAPRLAEVMHDRLVAPGVLLVVTIRGDGSPRLSPMEPLLFEGDLCVSMMWQSRKAVDVSRDDRVLVHSITTKPAGEAEVKVRGRALAVDDLVTRARYCDAVEVLGWRPEEPYFHLYRVDIDDVTVIRYTPNGDQYEARWPARSECLRQATSPTSVGPAEPVVELFRSPNA